MKLGEAFIEVRPDTKAFRADLQRDTQADVASVGRTLQQALIGGAFLAGAKKATDAASQLEQAVGGTAAVFGESAVAIDRWSREAAESAGLSERAARELTSQIGGLLKGFGFTETAAADLSIQLAQLGADLAATFGGKPEEAVQALAAALRGETDPIERYGIALNQQLVNQRAVALGLAESTSKVDQHAKAQATLALITERSADAQGQFAREAETAAGQAAISAAKTENAAADLGENLLPIYTKISEVVGVVADAFGALPEPAQTAVIALGGIAALYGPLKAAGEALGSLATIARTQVARGLDAAATGAYSLAGNLGRITAGLGAVGAAAALGISIWQRNAEEARLAAEAARAFADAIRDSGDATAGTEARIEEIIRTGAPLGEILDRAKLSSSDLAEALRGSNSEFEAMKDRLVALEGDDTKVLLLKEGLDDLRAAAQAGAEQVDTEGRVIDETGDAAESAAPKVGELTGQIDAEAQAAKDAAEALQGLLDATLAQFDANLGYRQSLDDVEGSLADLAETQREHGADSEEYRDALDDVEGALLDQADAALRLFEDTAKANGETLTAQQRTAIYRSELERLRDGLAPGSPLRKALDGYIADLDSIPDSITTTLNLIRPTISGSREDQLLQAQGYAAGGDVMDGLFRVHEGEVMRKDGERVEVLAGSPTPLSAGLSDVMGAQILAALLALVNTNAEIAGNTAGPTTSTRLRRVQTMAGAI